MSDILIRGMEMPKSSHWICVFIDGDGTVTLQMRGGWASDDCYTVHKVSANEKIGEAIPVPAHGRLIDADELYEDCALDHDYEVMATTTRINEYMQLKIDDAPTIISAEGD